MLGYVPDSLRKFVVARAQGFTFREISCRMHVTTKTVLSAIKRTQRKLQEEETTMPNITKARAFTEQEQAYILRLREENKTIREIADEMKVSRYKIDHFFQRQKEQQPETPPPAKKPVKKPSKPKNQPAKKEKITMLEPIQSTDISTTEPEILVIESAVTAKDTCVLSPAVGRRASDHSLLKCSPEVFRKVKDLSERLNRLPMEITNTLLEFALARIEITMPKEG